MRVEGEGRGTGRGVGGETKRDDSFKKMNSTEELMYRQMESKKEADRDRQGDTKGPRDGHRKTKTNIDTDW